MKKSFQAIAASCALAALLALPGCGSGSSAGQKVYFAAHAEATDFTGKLYEGVKSNMPQGVDVEFLNANGDANLQIDQLNEAISQKPAAIVVLAVDGDAVIPAIEKANQAGVPVIATNRDLNGGKFASVMSDEKQAGKLQGEYLAKHLPQGAKIVYLMGESSQSSARLRWEGFKEACLDKRSDIQLLAKADGNWSEAEGLKDMTLWGRDQGVIVSGVDAMDYAIKSVAAGEMSQTIKQDADKTSEGIANLLKTALSGTIPTDEVKIPFTEITKENAAQFK